MRNEAAWLLTIATILIIIGGFIGYSVEGVKQPVHDFISRFLLILIVGVVLFITFALMEYNNKINPLIFSLLNGAVLALLLMVLVFGEEVNGAKRWINLIGGFKLQPSEFAKYVVILDLAIYYAYFRDRVKSLFFGIFVPLLISGAFCGLIFLERDLGTPIVIMSCVFIIMLYVGVNWKFFVILMPFAFLFILIAVLLEEYRIERIINTIFFTRDIKGAGAQVFQAMVAYYRGGLFGVGLGKGISKSGALPLPSRDFPFALWAEETGIIGAVFLILLFCAFVYIGIETAKNAPNFKASILALGITALIGIQSLFMILVNEGWLPVKGMCIPFVSMGGSSLTANMMMLGSLVSIALQKKRIEESRESTMSIRSSAS